MSDKLYELMDWPEIEAVVYSEEYAPREILGPHVIGDGVLIQCFFPGADKVTVKMTKDGREYPMSKEDDAGYFAVLLSGRKIPEYTYLVEQEGEQIECYDAYAFPCQITLEEELDGLEDYIYLQQMRFDGRITVEKSIRVQPAAVLVPSFILQPVVENAYSHGLKSCEEGGRVLLRAWMQGSVLVLTVADNGRGMTAEELDTLQARIAQSEQTGRSIGLGNISRRIGMLYPGGKMQVYSRAGRGTVVRVEIPQTQWTEEREGEPS